MGTRDTDSFYLIGVVVRFLARNAETGGYCVCEATVAPGAGAPPNHHAGEDEAFYVLEGSFDFTVGEETRRVGAGDFVKIPDGAVHAFTNVGETPGRLLIMNAPGLVHERFFGEAGEPLPPGTRDLPSSPAPPDIPRLLAAGARAGIVFPRPGG